MSAFPLSRSQSSLSQDPLHRYVIRLHWTDKSRKVSEEARHGIYLCDYSSTGVQLPEVVLAKVLGSTTLRPEWEGSLHLRESWSSFSPATLFPSGPGICRTKGHTYSQLPNPHLSNTILREPGSQIPCTIGPRPTCRACAALFPESVFRGWIRLLRCALMPEGHAKRFLWGAWTEHGPVGRSVWAQAQDGAGGKRGKGMVAQFWGVSGFQIWNRPVRKAYLLR